MVAIIDYGVGNLFSLKCSLAAIGAESVVTGDADTILRADRVILPGVGAFADAYAKLCAAGMDRAVYAAADAGKPLLGICLGMQLLFERSYEYGEHRGLGLLKGEVIGMDGTLPAGLDIPQIGWNALHKTGPSRILANTAEGEHVYFVHSYYASGCGDSLAATTEYGLELTAAVEKANVCGCQFHPEKSGAVGLGILRAFCAMEG